MNPLMNFKLDWHEEQDNYDQQIFKSEFKEQQEATKKHELEGRLMKLVGIGFLSTSDFEYLKRHFE